MSVRLQTYLGPYFNFPNKKTEIVNSYNSCLQSNCKNYKTKKLTGNFCDQCGTKVTEAEDKVTRNYHLWDLSDEYPEMNIDDCFWVPDEKNIVLCNREYYIGFDDDDEVNFADYDFTSIKEKFIKENDKVLTLINSKIGEVKVKFRIIQYYS